MRINIRLAPMEDGRWHWLCGRAGVMSRSGTTTSYEKARKAAEDSAMQYAQEVEQAQNYLFDTESRERIGYKAEEGK